MDDFSSSDIIIQPHFENIDSFYFVKFNYQKESSPTTNSFHFENQILSSEMNHETQNNNNNTNSRQTPSVTIENKRTTESTYKNGQTNKQLLPENNNFIHNTIEQLVQKVFHNEKAKPSNLEIVAEQSLHNFNAINENKQLNGLRLVYIHKDIFNEDYQSFLNDSIIESIDDANLKTFLSALLNYEIHNYQYAENNLYQLIDNNIYHTYAAINIASLQKDKE